MVFSKKNLILFTFLVSSVIFGSLTHSLQVEEAACNQITSLIKKGRERGWTQEQLKAKLLQDLHEYAFQIEAEKNNERIESAHRKLKNLGVVAGVVIVGLVIIALSNHSNYELERNRRNAAERENRNTTRQHEEIMEQAQWEHYLEVLRLRNDRDHAQMQLEELNNRAEQLNGRVNLLNNTINDLRGQNRVTAQLLAQARHEVSVRDRVLDEAGRQYRAYREQQENLVRQQRENNQISRENQPEEYVVRDGMTIPCMREGENLIPHVESID